MFAVNPDLLNFLPDHAVFLPYPIDESHVVRKEKYQVKDKIRIVHAPTQRAAKGTDDVLEAVERIQRLYPDTIELRLIERVKHEEAMKLYREADLVIDQLRVGWYGGLAKHEASMEYVHRWHAAEYVASITKRYYES